MSFSYLQAVRSRKLRSTVVFGLIITISIIVINSYLNNWQYFFLTRHNSPVCSLSQASRNPDQDSFPLKYLTSPDHICQKDYHKKFLLLIIVCSGVKNAAARQTIRQTWGSRHDVDGSNIRLAFLLGDTMNKRDAELVHQETIVHSDIIQMDFLDTYPNLTYKSVALLKWVSERCPNAKYVLKTDDDMYINVPHLAATVSNVTKKNAMIGFLIKNQLPIRDQDHRWHVPETLYPGSIYPDYLSGGAYVMSVSPLPRVYAECQKQPYVVLEDLLVTGICACRASVELVHHSGFTFEKRPASGCAFREAISSHGHNRTEMQKIKNELSKGTGNCS